MSELDEIEEAAAVPDEGTHVEVITVAPKQEDDPRWTMYEQRIAQLEQQIQTLQTAEAAPDLPGEAEEVQEEESPNPQPLEVAIAPPSPAEQNRLQKARSRLRLGSKR